MILNITLSMRGSGFVTSIFDITSERFFMPLACKNRKIYMDAILFLNEVINGLFEAQDNDKTKIIDKLTNHLDDLVEVKLYKDDSGDEYEDKLDNRSKAALIINKLIDYGWLSEEMIGNNKTLDFNDYSYDFIDLIEKIVANNKPPYTSYVKQIKNVINQFDYSTVDDIEIVDNALNNFVVALRGLRSKIQTFYKHITKTVNLSDLLKEFTGEYKEYFFDSAYLNLKIRDGVDFEIPRIAEQLEKILHDSFNMEKLIDAKMKEKGFEMYGTAKDYIDKAKKRIITNIRTCPLIIEMIDTKNERYLARTTAVITHLIKRGEDIEGILNRLIDEVKNDKVVDENFAYMFTMHHYTFNSLSRPRNYNPKAKPDMLPVDSSVSNEAKNKALEILKEDSKYNVKNVNKYVSNFLNGDKQKKISEQKIKSKYEFVMIISIMMYSKLPKANYEIELLSERIKRNGISFNDFIIKQKENV